MEYQTVHFLKGTSFLKKIFSYMENNEEHADNYESRWKEINKISTDNGHTWNFLKIVDPRNKDNTHVTLQMLKTVICSHIKVIISN